MGEIFEKSLPLLFIIGCRTYLFTDGSEEYSFE